jgi:hypothetical protein
MACLKCGSDWVTLKGKDMVSCAECCRQQRCKARKQGRLLAEEFKRCDRCGCEFVASGGNAMARSRHCSSCSELARQDYLRARKDKIKSGEWKPKPQRKLKGRKCLRCGSQLNPNQSKYCGGECYNSAKKEGIQSWDRTGQLESIWHRGGIWACAPSREPVRQMLNNMTLFLAKVAKAYSRASRKAKACEVCGEACYGFAARFCSVACLTKVQRVVSCIGCSAPCHVRGVSAKKLCLDCIRVARKKYGGKHRTRARYYGVKYVRFRLQDIYERDAYTCQICRKRVYKRARYRKSDGKIHPRSPSIDHIVPMSRGGNHEPHNCQTACIICNTRKGVRGGGQLRLSIK